MTAITDRPAGIDDRYLLRDGEVVLTGVQALARVPLDQHRIDERNGLHTATLVSGYPGSPLAGFDLELSRWRLIFESHDVLLKPAINEELAATTVQGTQLASRFGELTHDGIVGIWFGKAPGLDRATDAIRHGNCGGAGPTGGVLVVVGDDSIAKSSAVPSSSEMALAEIGTTVLSPCDPQDVLDLGLHGIALSRFCGLWTGLKIATNVADGSGTVVVRPQQVQPVMPDRTIDGAPFQHVVSANYLAKAHVAEIEDSMMTSRLELACRYARANGINRIEGDPAAKIGFVAAGAPYLDLHEALAALGIEHELLASSGIRILKLGMVSPVEPRILHEFAEGLDEIVVVEEKRGFIESAIKSIFYGRTPAPAVYGKRGPDGSQLLRSSQDLPPDLIAAAIAPRILAHAEIASVRSWLERPHRPETAGTVIPVAVRPPYFCSGCPHSRSSIVPDGSLVGLGIGCSALAVGMPEERVGPNIGLCQMGGEGVLWMGMAPFLKTEKHFVQGLGDGTYHHSASMAIRASVAAKSNITYKLLYNGTVAMTGGQDVAGLMGVPEVVSELVAEGVAKVVVTTADPGRYKGIRLAGGTEVRDRDRLLETQEELAGIAGVTVLIHEQDCAAELRRQRKRNLIEAPKQRVFINERICEGCGDCGVKSNCLSVWPVDTVFGRKTKIDQASCNLDFTCLDGDCPAFVSVVPGKQRPAWDTLEPVGPDDLPEPVLKVNADDFNLRITGIGGTGVVTIARILSTAALMSGKHVRGLDRLGMAQKGGAVVSDIRVSPEPFAGSNSVRSRGCDLYLGCDILVASAEPNLEAVSASRTIAVVSTSRVPTGPMVADPAVGYPETDTMVARISRMTRADEGAFADSRELTKRLYGDDQYANILLVGMAIQAGALPIEAASIERAIELNGVAVETNLQAFRRGRQFIADPDRFARALPPGPGEPPEPSDEARRIADTVQSGGDEELASTVLRSVEELIAYQRAGYAERYAAFVESVRQRESAALGAAGPITRGVSRYLYKLMAYKDEYEVARLALAPAFESELRREFGSDVRYAFRLHPPILRSMGLKRKISLGRWFKPILRMLYRMRGLRGTWADPFGRGEVRRTERALIGEYTDAMNDAVAALTSENRGSVIGLAELPDLVRGYEQIKLANVEKFRDRMAGLMTEIRGS